MNAVMKMDIADLEAKRLSELRNIARDMEISGYSRLKKEDLILRLLQAKAEREGLIFGGGVLDVVDDNMGFLRAHNYLPGPKDVYVSQSQIRRFGLQPRSGDLSLHDIDRGHQNFKDAGHGVFWQPLVSPP